jgi:membrane-associated protein
VSWLSGIGEVLLAEIIAHGYPMLALTLLVAAIGVPLPSGLALVLAGGLAEQGHLSWAEAGIVALLALGLGDTIGYLVGRLAGRELLERYGWRVWVTPERLARAERAFRNSGALSIVATRNVLAPLSPYVNLVAGASRYRLGAFVPLGVAGRVPWVGAYLGLGYVAGENVEAAADLLGSLGELLVLLAIIGALLACLVWMLRRRQAAVRRGAGGAR